jgi:hypothetical protein
MIERPPGYGLLPMSLFYLLFFVLLPENLKKYRIYLHLMTLFCKSFFFVQGMNSVRGTTGRPSDGSVYSVTSRGEVLFFDPEAARNSGEEENSVVGKQFYS